MSIKAHADIPALPWHIEGHKATAGVYKHIASIESPCSLVTVNPFHDDAEAILQAIVLRVNSHDTIIQALKDCLEMLRYDGYSAGTSATVADAEAALAKAGAQ